MRGPRPAHPSRRKDFLTKLDGSPGQARQRHASSGPRKRVEVKDGDELTSRIRINEAAPATTMERLPSPFGLGEPIGHSVNDRGMMTHAAMAAFNLDAFRSHGNLFHAALPGADAVGAAEDRGGWHGRRFRKRSAEPLVLFVGAAPACHLVNAP